MCREARGHPEEHQRRTADHQKLEGRPGTAAGSRPQKETTPWHFDLDAPASRTEREHISVVHTTQSEGVCSRPRDTTRPGAGSLNGDADAGGMQREQPKVLGFPRGLRQSSETQAVSFSGKTGDTTFPTHRWMIGACHGINFLSCHRTFHFPPVHLHQLILPDSCLTVPQAPPTFALQSRWAEGRLHVTHNDSWIQQKGAQKGAAVGYRLCLRVLPSLTVSYVSSHCPTSSHRLVPSQCPPARHPSSHTSIPPSPPTFPRPRLHPAAHFSFPPYCCPSLCYDAYHRPCEMMDWVPIFCLVLCGLQPKTLPRLIFNKQYLDSIELCYQNLS